MSTAERVLRAESCSESSEVSILLTDDAGITMLNAQYLDRNEPTDVLSFYLLGKPDQTQGILGDVVISTETASRQAKEWDKSLDDELDLLLAHGILHLLGYTDYSDETRQQMQDRVAEIIGREAAR